MAQIITVKEVSKVTNKTKGQNKWSEFEVTYDSDKGEKVKKFASFDQAQYKIGKSLEEGKSYDVRFEKDGDYWKWTGAEEVEEGAQAAKAAPRAGGGNNWDARLQFDKEKQPWIVRQSMVDAAVAFGAGKDLSVDEVIAIADQFYNFVFNGIEKAEDVDPAPVKKSPGRPKKEVADPDVE